MSRGFELAGIAAALLVAACSGAPAGNGPDTGGAGGVGGAAAGSGGGGNVKPESASVPAELVGSWYAGSGYTSAPYDPATGAWGTPTGKGLVYLFRADGSYTKGFQSYVSNGGCTTGFSAFEEGFAEFAGQTLTTYPQTGHVQYKDSCAPSLDSDEPVADLSAESFTWTLHPSEYDPTLIVLDLSRSDGAMSTFMPL